MANPTKPTIAYDYVGFQAEQQGSPFPGTQLQNDLSELKRGVDDTIDALGNVRRSDGAVANKTIGYDQLKDELDGFGFNPPTDWETDTSYIARDTVFHENSFYRAVESHTSGVFADDLAAGKWLLIVDFTVATADAVAAKEAAEAAQAIAETAAGTATTQAGIATTGADTATTQAGVATTQAGTATTKAGEASVSAGAASTAASAAVTARDFAAQWASDPEDGTPIDDGTNPAGQSAFHWSEKASAASAAAIAAAGTVIAPKPTVAAVEADDPASDPTFYETAFFDTNQRVGSGAKYAEGAEAAHDLKLQNANGVAWFNIAEPILRPEMAGAVGDGVVDDTLAIQKVLAAGAMVELGPKTYKISDYLALRGGHHIEMDPLTVIQQVTANKQAFYGFQKDAVTIRGNGGMLLGEGSYTMSASGNTGRYARGIDLEQPGRTYVENLRIRNFGGSGVAILGGGATSRKFFKDLTIEGTNGYGDPVVSQDNFQNGYFLAHNPAYGAAADNIVVEGGEVSGTAQGFMSEHNDGAPPQNINVDGVFFHDITGQHAAYNSCGGITYSSCRARDIELAGIKVQGGDANQDIDGVTVTGFEAEHLGGNMFEVVTVTSYTGIINNVRMQGKGKNVGRALALGNFVRNSHFDVMAETCTGEGISLAGDLLNDVNIVALLEGCVQDGILVNTTNSQMKIKAAIRNPNSGNTGRWGVLVASTATGNNLEFEDLDIQDSGLLMAEGVRIDAASNEISFTGNKLRARGAKNYGLRFPLTSNPVVEIPEIIDVNGAAGGSTLTDLSGWYSIPGLGAKSSRWMPTKQQTAGGATAQVWAQFLEDEGAYIVETHVVGKLAGSTQRAAYIHRGLFYRDGGGIVTKEGSSVVTMSVASAGWTGSIALQSNGANLVIVNVVSGAAGTCDWTARTRVLRVN